MCVRVHISLSMRNESITGNRCVCYYNAAHASVRCVCVYLQQKAIFTERNGIEHEFIELFPLPCGLFARLFSLHTNSCWPSWWTGNNGYQQCQWVEIGFFCLFDWQNKLSVLLFCWLVDVLCTMRHVLIPSILNVIYTHIHTYTYSEWKHENNGKRWRATLANGNKEMRKSFNGCGATWCFT